MFVGHDHFNDYVGEKDGIWLSYGCVSGFTEPTYYFNEDYQPMRGGRVIQYNSMNKELSTWIEYMEERNNSSFVSKRIL